MNKTSFIRTLNDDFERQISFTNVFLHLNNIVTVEVENNPKFLKAVDTNNNTHFIKAVDFYSRAEIVEERE